MTGSSAGTGADFLQLRPGDAPPRGRAGWLADAVRAAVADGRLPVGSPVPGSRQLAGELGFARGVVVEAYRRLTEEGLLAGRVGAATTVVAVPRSPSAAPAVPVLRVPRLPLTGAQPDAAVEFDLSPGVPDLAAFPRAAWLAAERRVLATASSTELGYGDPRGHPRLREQLARRLARTRGITVAPEQVVVVAGVAQSLALVAHLLRRRGHDRIGVEEPGSRGARDELAWWGLRPVPVAVDDDGLDVAALAAADVPAVLVTPAHQFPLGVVLAPGRRRALLDWARAGRLVVEDDYDAEHRYDRSPVPALHASAPDAVVHTGSLSKTLAPGVRLGWLVPPPDLLADVIDAKHHSDLGNPVLQQLVVADLLAVGALDRHLRQVRRRQRERRDALVTALTASLPPERVLGVAAGLHVVLTVPGDEPDTAVAARLSDHGVRVQPLSLHRALPGPPGLVIGYAAHPPDRLRAAAARIVAALR